MAWWFAIPIVVAGAKLLYEAVQDNSDFSSNPAPSNTNGLRNAKSKRTKARKDVVRNIIRNNRALLVERLNSDITGYASITKTENDEYTVSFEKINEIISSMQSMMNHQEAIGNNENLYNIQFCNIDDKVTEIVHAAKSEYGALSGINAQDEYVQDQDAFIFSFKSAANDATS